MEHVFHFCRTSHSGCSDLGRRDDFFVPRVSTIGQGQESGPGIHGAVSIRSVAISASCLGCNRDIVDHRPNVVGTSWYLDNTTVFMAGTRHGQADVGWTATGPDSAA